MGKIKKIMHRSVLFCLSIFFILPSFVSAAKMSISPQAGTINADSSFTINILVSSSDQVMNGVSGSISFPTDLLSISSISKFGSIINVWAQEPTFSNTAGSINFEGVALSPGFSGTNGKVISVTFRALKSGTANIKFSNGSVLANDGMGTDILNGLGNSQFKINEAVSSTIPKIPVISDIVAKSELAAPAITYYKSKIQVGDSIVTKGLSQYTNAKVIVYLQYENNTPDSHTILTDIKGEYVFAETTGAKEGIYRTWVQSLGEDGSVSTSSPIMTLFVNAPLYGLVIDQTIINIFIILLILFIFLYLMHHAFQRRHRTKRDFSDIMVHSDKLANVKLNNFMKYIDKQIDVLESNEKFGRLHEYETLVESFKKSITDYKNSLDKKDK